MFSPQNFSPKIRQYVNGLIFLLLAGLVLSSFAFAINYLVSARNEWKSRHISGQISFSGEGKVTVTPDIATFTASVLTEEKKVKDAQTKNTERSNAIFSFLKQSGVAEKDLKTTGYTIYPQYRYFNSQPCVNSYCPPVRQPEIISYQVRHTIEVKARDLSKADDLLQGVVSVGANEVSGLTFTVDDQEAVKAEARKRAIDAAKDRASVLARNLGVRLGRIVDFSEGGGNVPIVRYGMDTGIMSSKASAPTPEIQPGEQEYTTSVTITYELK